MSDRSSAEIVKEIQAVSGKLIDLGLDFGVDKAKAQQAAMAAARSGRPSGFGPVADELFGQLVDLLCERKIALGNEGR